MITDEARAVFEQAIELRDSNPDDKLTNLDVLGLLLVAIDKAGGSYPEAETETAWIYLSRKNYDKARYYADSALESNPNLFRAQSVKVVLATRNLPGFFAQRKYQSEMGKLLHIFETLCNQHLKSEDFLHYTDLLTDILYLAASENSFSALAVYRTIAAAPIDRLIYESDSDKADVEQICLIAHGHVRFTVECESLRLIR